MTPRRSLVLFGAPCCGTGLLARLLAGPRALETDLVARALDRPWGGFESADIAAIDDALLASALARRVGDRPVLGPGQHWLARPPAAHAFALDPGTLGAVEQALAGGGALIADTRLCFTWSAWRAPLAGARRVCVFRDPRAARASVMERVEADPQLAATGVDGAWVEAQWCASYRAVLEHEDGEETLFVEFDSLFEPAACAALEQRLGRSLTRELLEPLAPRRGDDLDDLPRAGEAARNVLAELRARAAVSAVRAPVVNRAARPLVSVVALVDASNVADLPALVRDVEAQRGVSTELVLVDRSAQGLELEAAAPRASIVREPSWSRGAAWQAGFEGCRGSVVALALPGVRCLPTRLVQATEALAEGEHDVVSADALLMDASGAFVSRTHMGEMGDVPPPLFEAGLVARREALATLARTAFHPVELAWWRTLHAAGRARHLAAPGSCLPRALHDARFERSRDDALLVGLAQQADLARRPLLSVSLCTFDRREILRGSLEAFCRQQLTPGTFELILVDDGSRDGTWERLRELELPVPFRRLRQPNAGLPTARNKVLALARGRYGLFVNDDTIPFPDCIARHLALHAEFERTNPEPRMAVLGSFEQPPEALGHALTRQLEGCSLVFPFASMTPGETYGGERFITANVSAPLDAVRAVGGWDPGFVPYGCDDIDVGLKLEARGFRVLYDPRARAYHHHVLEARDLRRRQTTVGQTAVRLQRKHPVVIERWKTGNATRAELLERLSGEREALGLVEAALMTLGDLDLDALEEVDAQGQEAAREIVAQLDRLLPPLSECWWNEGWARGLEAARLDSLGQVLETGLAPRAFAGRAPFRILAAPGWQSQAELESLFEDLEPALAPGESAGVEGGLATLILLRDPGRTPDREAALELLDRAFAAVRARGDGARLDPEVVLVEEAYERIAFEHLGRSVDAHWVLPATPPELTRTLVAQPLRDRAELERWVAPRRLPAADAQLPDATARESTPEVSVIVPTRDRPRELAQLLAALDRCDLEPGRFEVLVVDDGSRQAAVDRAEHAYACQVLRQAPCGPAAARNRGVAAGRGELVVFFNDDAVPAPDCLRRHLDAHGASAAPQVVLGSFPLQARHVRDSFAVWIERSNGLFAQPLMRPGVVYHGASLCTGNVSLPRALLEAVGGFDEGFEGAGGEDSELGLRLEAELGVRVRYEPRARADHDHALDVRSFAARRRAVGRAAHRIGARFPEFGGGTVARDEAGWEDLARELEGAEELCGRIVTRVETTCARERDEGGEPQAIVRLRPQLEELSRLSFLLGLHEAHAAGEESAPDDAGRPGPEPEPLGAAGREFEPVVAQPSEGPSSATYAWIVGAMKCGTTALFHLLGQHPEVAGARQKEPDFFSDPEVYARGMDWYHDLFDWDPARHRVRLEASTSYAKFPERRFRCPATFASKLGDVRILYVVRDPVERIRSHYLHALSQGIIRTSIEDGLNPNPLILSNYHLQLAPYAAWLGRDKILVLSHDELLRDPVGVARRAARFLGLPDFEFQPTGPQNSSDLARARLLVRQLQAGGLGDLPEPVEGQRYDTFQRRLREVLAARGQESLLEPAQARAEASYTPSAAQAREIQEHLRGDLDLFARDFGVDPRRAAAAAAKRAPAPLPAAPPAAAKSPPLGHGTDLERELQGLPGTASPEEALLLHDLALRTSRGAIVDVGVPCERSARALALGTRAGQSMDVRRAVSGAPWSEPIGLLWIHGDGARPLRESELDLWLPHLVEGGVVAVGAPLDTTGEPRALTRACLEGGAFRMIHRVGGIEVLRFLGAPAHGLRGRPLQA